jgi:hypothetical protein
MRLLPEVIEMSTKRVAEECSLSVRTNHERKICERTQGLDSLLPSTVDETLKHVFKEAGAEVIYRFLGNKCHLKREEFAKKPEDFSAGFESLLGSAAPMIEKAILENLWFKLGLRFEEKEGYEFSDYIRELKGKGEVDK